MKVSTLRMTLYLILAAVILPSAEGNPGVYMSYAYYSLMTAVTLLFMRRDGIRWNFWIPNYKRGVLKGLLAFPIFLLVGYLTNLMFPIRVKSQSGVDPHSASVFVLVVLIAPIVEELMFRGYVQEYFRGRFKPEWTVMISAFIFSLFHPLDLFPQVFVSGVFMAYLRESSGSILPGMIVHLLNNLVGYISAVLAG